MQIMPILRRLVRVKHTAIALVLLLAGCDDGGPRPIPVDGTVTFGGGSWPTPGRLNFTVESPVSSSPGRPATGDFDTDGHVIVTSFKKGDGLLPGKYKIGVECWEAPPQMNGTARLKSYVPERFQSPATSGLTVSVEPADRVVHLKLDVAKQ